MSQQRKKYRRIEEDDSMDIEAEQVGANLVDEDDKIFSQSFSDEEQPELRRLAKFDDFEHLRLYDEDSIIQRDDVKGTFYVNILGHRIEHLTGLKCMRCNKVWFDTDDKRCRNCQTGVPLPLGSNKKRSILLTRYCAPCKLWSIKGNFHRHLIQGRHKMKLKHIVDVRLFQYHLFIPPV